METTWGGYSLRENLEQEGSEDNGMIIIPLRLLKKIDRNRDRFSRVEFIEFCLNTLLEQGGAQSEVTQPPPELRRTKYHEAEDTASRSISRSEFEQFKRDIKDLMRSHINLLRGAILEPTNEITFDEQDRFRQRITDVLG